MRVLVTGGAGFIGSNFIDSLFRSEVDCEIVNIDFMKFPSPGVRLHQREWGRRYTLLKKDICDERILESLNGIGFDFLIHFAAETHVDRSIFSSAPFIRTNVEGTRTLLEFARTSKVGRFIHISTDEVYGPAPPDRSFTEDSPLRPTNPYSASKASSDLLALAYFNTYNIPVVIIRLSNNFGPHQYIEKLIPLTIIRAIDGKFIPIYGDGSNIRDWMYVGDTCRAIIKIMKRGRVGEIYNISCHNEMTNLEVVKTILEILGRDESLIRFIRDRPGHDRRYSMNTEKVTKEFGLKMAVDFHKRMEETIDWYKKNRQWWKRALEKEETRAYFKRLYGDDF